MAQLATWHSAPGAGVAALLLIIAAGSGAVPTTNLDDTDPLATARRTESSVVRPLAPAVPGVRSTDRALHPETSTGNKNLDLLLELQDQPGEAARPGAPRSAAAAAAAAAALADLRARAAERPAADPPAARPVMQPLEGIGTLERDGPATQQRAERREWTGGPAGGGAGGAYGKSDAYRADDRESAILRRGYSDDDLLRRLPKEIIGFLRDNRYWLLGALGVVALLGAALKAYSRRI